MRRDALQVYGALSKKIKNSAKGYDDTQIKEDVNQLKQDLENLETILRAIQDKLNSGSSVVDTVTVNEINDMIVEYFENKTALEVEA